MAKTKIEWADETQNVVSGCTKISPGCKNCFAEKFSHRLQAMGVRGYESGFKPTPHPWILDQIRTMKKPRRIFLDSMGDLFHDEIPETYIQRVFWDIARQKQHTFLILTKRPERMAFLIARWIADGVTFYENCTGRFPPHIIPGVSCEDQKTADERIPILLQIPAAVRFVSFEPLLGSMGNIDHYLRPGGLSWVIAGGETGPGARRCDQWWIWDIWKDCRQFKIPFFFKSWGALSGFGRVSTELCEEIESTRQFPEVIT